MVFTDSGRLGVDVTATPAGTGTSSNEGNDFAVGTVVTAKDNQEWMKVHAATVITQFDAVGIDENYEASALTKAMADDGWAVGFAQVAFADNDFGWVAIKGSNINVRVAASCAADVSLYTTSTAGVLDDTSASQTLITGIVMPTLNATASATNVEVNAAVNPLNQLQA